MVHFILEPFNDTVRYADYSIFHIDDESTKYLLNVTGYSGNAGMIYLTCFTFVVRFKINRT